MTVECKRYRELPDVMSGSSAQLESWLVQLMESSQPDDFMILIMKGDRKPALAAVEAKHGIDACVKGNHLRYRMKAETGRYADSMIFSKMHGKRQKGLHPPNYDVYPLNHGGVAELADAMGLSPVSSE